jgi:hypothetical protein
MGENPWLRKPTEHISITLFFALCLLFWVLYFGRCSHRPGQFPNCAVEAEGLRTTLPRAQWLVELAVHALSGQSTHRGRRAKFLSKSIVQSYLIWIFHPAYDWARRRRPAEKAGGGGGRRSVGGVIADSCEVPQMQVSHRAERSNLSDHQNKKYSQLLSCQRHPPLLFTPTNSAFGMLINLG